MSDLKTAQDFIDQAFKDAETAVKTRRTADNLTILGGQFDNDDNKLSQFLGAWQSDDSPIFKWMMAEEIDHVYVKPVTITDLMTRHDLLERVRLFGEAGDLDIRRDAITIHWRFISEAPLQLPSLPSWAKAVSYWNEVENQDRKFARHEQCYYQWRRDGKEPRVTQEWADDTTLAKKDLLLKQVQYLENGRVVFVRYVAFKEAQNE